MQLPVTAWNRREVGDRSMKVANVPMRKWGADLDQIPGDPDYVRVVRGYLANLEANLVKGDGLLLWGPPRSGKSSLAACVVREVAAHRCRAYWLMAPELVDGWAEQDHRYDFMREAHLVVLDDLGTEGGTEYRKDLVRQALRFRLEHAGATIVTTNMSPPDLKKHYGEKLAALLKECVKTIEVDGADWSKGAGA